MHFLHTSSILSVSLFEITKMALAKRYAHCCFVKCDDWRSGGLKQIRIRVPTAAGRTFFVLRAMRGDATFAIWWESLCENRYFGGDKILKLQKKSCSHVGLARRNFENHEREKNVRILQWFSFNFEDENLMMPNLRSEVKNANGVNTVEGFTIEKTILAWEVLKNSRMCTGTATAARKKKVSAVMHGSADSLELRKSQAGTTNMQKSDLPLAFWAHQIS